MKRIKKIISVLLVFALTFTAIMVPQVTAEAKEGKTVVIYFTGTGTTEKVAKKIKKATNGTLIKIQAMEPYTAEDLDWTDDNSRVTVEHESADSPAVSTVRPGISNLEKIEKAIKKADVVYIGYPIWWGEAPHIVYNLIENVNLKGKAVVPFCTSMSSGLGDSAKNLKGNATLDNTKWLSGKGWYEDSLPSQKSVNKWVKKITKKIKTAEAVTSDQTETADADSGKTAVVYYSASGTTKARAQEVYAAIGSDQADLIEIVPAQVYTEDDLNWSNDSSRVSTEHTKMDANNRVSVRPELSAASKNVNLSGYDHIIIGYPIWWYDASWVVWSFLDQHKAELFGKTVIPFCTSASSSVERSVESLKAMYPDIVIDGNNAARLTSSNATEWAMNLKKN